MGLFPTLQVYFLFTSPTSIFSIYFTISFHNVSLVLPSVDHSITGGDSIDTTS